jgi:hypothetical protein
MTKNKILYGFGKKNKKIYGCSNYNKIQQLKNFNRITYLKFDYGRDLIIDCFPKKLFELEVRITNNSVIKLSNLPNTLAVFDCNDCGIHNLHDICILPSGLKNLHCEQNTIHQLPDLPSTLKKLYCGFNKLTYLRNLPVSLRKLCCEYNNICDISKLYSLKNLEILNCENNKLPELIIPNKIRILMCSNNPLKSVSPLKPNINLSYYNTKFKSPFEKKSDFNSIDKGFIVGSNYNYDTGHINSVDFFCMIGNYYDELKDNDNGTLPEEYLPDYSDNESDSLSDDEIDIEDDDDNETDIYRKLTPLEKYNKRLSNNKSNNNGIDFGILPQNN